MLPVHAVDIRLSLHILGASIWVGGQIVLAILVPAARQTGGPPFTRVLARRFQFVAWPAYALLLGTGVWNLFAIHVGDQSSAYLTTLFVKLVLVGVSGAGALAHTMLARTRPALGGALAAVGLTAALAAAFLGVVLAG